MAAIAELTQNRAEGTQGADQQCSSVLDPKTPLATLRLRCASIGQILFTSLCARAFFKHRCGFGGGLKAGQDLNFVEKTACISFTLHHLVLTSNVWSLDIVELVKTASCPKMLHFQTKCFGRSTADLLGSHSAT